MRSPVVALALGLFAPVATEARPLAFAGGTVIGYEAKSDLRQLMAAHSPRRQFGYGLHYARMPGTLGTGHDVLPMLTLLVKRWNDDFSQANVYASAGAGLYRDGPQNLFEGAGALEADYETRRFYVSGRAQVFAPADRDPRWLWRVRAGSAPYLTEINGLHAWILFEVDGRPWRSHPEYTPVLRFFHQNLSFEGGVSFSGETHFAFATEF